MQKKKRGISLIVLVITIIVMIILGGAVIISLNNSGIIERANIAVKAYNEDEVNHIAQMAWSEAYINNRRTVPELTSGVRTGLINAGLNPDDYGMVVTTTGVTIAKGWLQDGLIITKGNVTLEAGDLIQYNAGVTGYTGAWKVLGAEDGNLLIMSTTDVSSLKLGRLEGGTITFSTGTETYEYGLLNGIARLNEICSSYGSGIGAIGARSIKVEDIDKLTGFDKTTYGGVNGLDQYGNEVTYSWNTSNNGKVDYTSTNGISGTLSESHNSRGFNYIDFNTMTKTTVEVNGTGMPTLTSNYYYYYVSDTTLPTNSAKAAEMIIGTSSSNLRYWLASPYVTTYDCYAYFGLRVVAGGRVSGNALALSHGFFSGSEYGVRAVVSLSSDIQVGEKDNTLGWSYTI